MFSFFADGMGGGQAEAAEQRRPPASRERGGGSDSGSGAGGGWPGQGQQRAALDLLLSPAVPLLATLAPCSFGGGEGGCRVVRRQ
jgi:hypothetical protein